MKKKQSPSVVVNSGLSKPIKNIGGIILLWVFSSYSLAAPPPGQAAQSCSTDFRLASSIQVNGNTQAAGSTGAAVNSLVVFDYSANGVSGTPLSAVPVGQVGSVWGMSYDTRRQKVYSSAFLKRHSGFGPGGVGAIYQFNPTVTQPSASLLIDLAAAGVDVGTDSRVPTNGIVDDPNELPAAVTDPSWDSAAFDQVGKMSLGGHCCQRRQFYIMGNEPEAA